MMCCPGTPAAHSLPPHAQTTNPATVPQHGGAGGLSSHPLLMLLTPDMSFSTLFSQQSSEEPQLIPLSAIFEQIKS